MIVLFLRTRCRSSRGMQITFRTCICQRYYDTNIALLVIESSSNFGWLHWRAVALQLFICLHGLELWVLFSVRQIRAIPGPFFLDRFFLGLIGTIPLFDIFAPDLFLVVVDAATAINHETIYNGF